MGCLFIDGLKNGPIGRLRAGILSQDFHPFILCNGNEGRIIGGKIRAAVPGIFMPMVNNALHTLKLSIRKLIKESRALNSIYPGNYDVKVGLIGCGMIGSMVAEMLKNFKLEVLVFDPFLSADKAASLGVRVTNLDEIFSTCQTVSNHLANNAQTKSMLNYSHFSKMLPYATFLNTGRGAQVVEDDLVRALTERPDLTAVLDVTYPEPAPLEHAFYSLPNCFLTPHIAGSLGNEVHRMAEYMYEEFIRYVGGEPNKYEVTEKMLETMA